MKRVWVITLGILNLIACGLLVVLYCSADWYEPYRFTWGLPMIIAAVVALICGIFTLKRKSWLWGFIGLFFAVLGLVYFGIIIYVSSF